MCRDIFAVIKDGFAATMPAATSHGQAPVREVWTAVGFHLSAARLVTKPLLMLPRMSGP